MMSGIGDEAMFMLIFVIGFPLLGAITGPLFSHTIRDDLLLFAYSALMITLTYILLSGHHPDAAARNQAEAHPAVLYSVEHR